MIVTATQLRESCFRRWYYKYHLWLDSSKMPGYTASRALATGIEFHELWKANEEVEEADTLAQVMWQAYQACQDVPGYSIDHFTIVEREKFLFGYVDDIPVAGRADGIGLLDEEPVLVELKTGRNKPAESYWQQREMDAQLSCYSYLTGIQRVVVEYIRTPSTAAARDGKFDEVLAEMLENASTYFYRIIISRSEADIARFKSQVKTWAEVVSAQFRIGDFLQCTNACNEYQRWCEFAPLCLGEMEADEVPTIEPYPELQPEIEKHLREIKAKKEAF